jgi:hypothetical protein
VKEVSSDDAKFMNPTGPNANIATALAEGSRKRVKADQGESGPVRRLVASQFGTVNAKLDNALKKVASQQNEIDHKRKKHSQVQPPIESYPEEKGS